MKIDKVKLKSTASRSLTSVGVSAAAVVIALAVGMLLVVAMQKDPAKAFTSMVNGAFGPGYFTETLVKMTPLLLTGISFALCNRCGLTNLGMEGQMYIGALFATLVGAYINGLPWYIHVPLCLIAGFIGGGLWCLITGLLKVFCGASEIITTVMLNWIAQFLIEYLINGPMIATPGGNPQTKNVLASARLGTLIQGSRLNWGFVIAIGCVVLFWLFISRSKKGYEVRVSGMNATAALYSGINIKKNILLVTFLAGGAAGLAGCIEILGVQKCIQSAFASGYGFDGIAVSLIGQNSPVGIVFGALLFGAFRAGGNNMMRKAQVPDSIVSVIQALVIIMVIGSQMVLEIMNEQKLRKQARKEA